MIKSVCTIAIFALSLPIAHAHADIVSNLVGYWNFDSGYTDSAGVANNGTPLGQAQITNTAGEWRVGGGALKLDGNGDFVRVNDHIEIDGNGSGGFTVAAFVKSPDYTNDNGFPNIAAKGGNQSYRFRVHDDGTGLAMKVGTGASDFPFVLQSLNTNQWYHVAATVDFSPKEVRFYVNGSLVGTPQSFTSSAIPNSANPLLIGAFDPQGLPGAEEFIGFIDDLRMYNRTLDASDIAELAAVPEPTSLAMFGIAMLGMSRRRRLKLK